MLEVLVSLAVGIAASLIAAYIYERIR